MAASQCDSKTEDKMFLSFDNVRKFIKDAIVLSGLKASHGELQAEVLLDADCRGKTSHGFTLLQVILANISEGTLVDSEPVILNETEGSAWIDGQGCLGAVVGNFAMKKAIEKASKNGVGWVTAKGSYHLGALGWYCMQAVEQGMIGLCISNTYPGTAATGSKQRVLGTNPICLAAAGLNGDYLLFDSALTVSAMRKVMEKTKDGDGTIPEGWGVDQDGKSTTDGARIVNNGALLPIGGISPATGGHKGFGLILLVEVLTSVLAGSAFPTDMGWRNESGEYVGKDFGQTFIAIDPHHFGGGFAERLQNLLDYIRNAEPVDESNPVPIPGDRGRHIYQQAEKEKGLWYPKHLIHQMNNQMKKLGGEYQLQ
nr:uncharacterized oxidoreductase YjmC-like [Lytechinus pictus]